MDKDAIAQAVKDLLDLLEPQDRVELVLVYYCVGCGDELKGRVCSCQNDE
jgi:hypothetical protein